MAILIVYYSLTGNTRTAASALAKELGADIEEIHCAHYKRGFWGFLKAGRDSWRDRLPPIDPLSHDPAGYDLVVVAGPIWAMRPATPVRALLRQYAGTLRNVAFLLTHGGSAGEKSLREMEQLAGKAPLASRVVREASIKSESYQPAVASLAADLRTKTAA